MTSADITTIQDRPRGDDVLKVIAARARDTTGVLPVYYVGHGRSDQDGNLYLAMHETDPASALWDRTAVPYPQIARLVRGIQAQAVVVILDCCFSGRALPSSGERGPVMPAGHGGGFVLTSAAREEHALAGTGGLLDDGELTPRQLLHHVAAQVIADRGGVPAGSGQQVLHPVRGGIPGMPGDRPAVLAPQARQ
jgi:hypothetical protein